MLSSIEPVDVCATRAALEERYVDVAPAYLDHSRGLRRSASAIALQGFCGVLPRELARRVRAAARRRVRRGGP
jgi:hypothetical protein